MDYEKEYKNALERARQVHTTNVDENKKSTEYIFPELVKSEDEKISKNIKIALLSMDDNLKDFYYTHHTSKEECIAWLEKQCGNVSPINDFTTEFERQVSSLIASSINKENDYTADYVKWTANALLNYAKKELEKQGANSATITKGDYSITNAEVVSYPTTSSTIEPKFKVGDWVIDKQNIVHQIANVIENITYHTYGYTIVGGGYFNNNTEGVRLWTIQDAKDGDILASNKSIFIFREEYIGEKPTAHCGLMNGLFIEGNGACWTNEKCYPATKEQRDLLFQKMKEAGYVWDNEKKKLLKYLIDESKSEIDYCFTKMMNGEKVSPTWSEEDEKNLQGITDEIQANKNSAPSYDIPVYDRYLSWLKSLKQRIGR